jgi:hypothetical protein
MTMPDDDLERVPERADVVADGLLARVRMTNDLVQRAGLAFAAAEDALRDAKARDAKDYSLTGAILLDKARQLAGDPAPRSALSETATQEERHARILELVSTWQARQDARG